MKFIGHQSFFVTNDEVDYKINPKESGGYSLTVSGKTEDLKRFIIEGDSLATFLYKLCLYGIAPASHHCLDFGGEETNSFLQEATPIIHRFAQEIDTLLEKHEETSTYMEELIKKHMKPHQQRVVDEKDELETRVNKLNDFIAHSEIFPTLPAEEQERLKRQNDIMWQYLEVLGERIAAFN